MNEMTNRMNKAKFYMDIGEMIFSKFHKIGCTDFLIELSDSKESVDNAIEFIESMGYTYKSCKCCTIGSFCDSEDIMNYANQEFAKLENPDAEHEYIFITIAADLIGFEGHFRPIYRIYESFDISNEHTLEVLLTTKLCNHSCMAEFIVCSDEIEKYFADRGLKYCGSGDYDNHEKAARVILMNAQHDIYAKEAHENFKSYHEKMQKFVDEYNMLRTTPATQLPS